MTGWIITLDKPENWAIASRNGLWATRIRKNIRAGDELFFWKTNPGGGLIAHAYAREDAREVTATEGVPWPDHAERNYRQRFDIEIRNDTGGDTLPHRWGELQEWAGFKQPALSSIVEIPSNLGRERLRHLFSDANEIPPAIRNQVDAVREEVHSDKDARNFTWRAIAERQGQRHFRDELIKAYDSCCCVTGCDAVPALEAAHIAPYRGEHTNELWNGLLLRADIHTLFDLFALTVDASTRTIRLSDKLRRTHYEELHGSALRPPSSPNATPAPEVLAIHNQAFGMKHGAP